MEEGSDDMDGHESMGTSASEGAEDNGNAGNEYALNKGEVSQVQEAIKNNCKQCVHSEKE